MTRNTWMATCLFALASPGAMAAEAEELKYESEHSIMEVKKTDSKIRLSCKPSRGVYFGELAWVFECNAMARNYLQHEDINPLLKNPSVEENPFGRSMQRQVKKIGSNMHTKTLKKSFKLK